MSLSPVIFLNHNGLAHLELGQLRIVMARIQRQIKYREKANHYYRLLSRTQGELSKLTTFALPDVNLSLPGVTTAVCNELRFREHLTRKVMLLEQMINLAAQFSVESTEGDDIFYEKLEIELDPFLDAQDHFLECIDPGPVKWNVSIAKENFRCLYVRIRLLLGKIYGRINIDIRGQIRSIIRFLYKSVDDEDDVANIFPIGLNDQFSNILNLCYEQERNSPKIRSCKAA